MDRVMLQRIAKALRDLADLIEAASLSDPAGPAILATRSPFDDSIYDLDLSVRGRKVLRRLEVTTIWELCQVRREQLERAKNCGKNTIAEIVNALAKRGLSLRGEPVPERSED